MGRAEYVITFQWQRQLVTLCRQHYVTPHAFRAGLLHAVEEAARKPRTGQASPIDTQKWPNYVSAASQGHCGSCLRLHDHLSWRNKCHCFCFCTACAKVRDQLHWRSWSTAWIVIFFAGTNGIRTIPIGLKKHHRAHTWYQMRLQKTEGSERAGHKFVRPSDLVLV